MRWIPRHLRAVLERAAGQFPAVILTGARQTGKTELCRRTFPGADYLTLDIPANAAAAEAAPEQLLGRYREPLILDEVQYCPGILRHLKVLIDADRRPGRFVLTGSQNFGLMQGVTESLAGRCAVLVLPTLSLAELSEAEPQVRDEAEFHWRSGFPELWQRRDTDRDLWLGSYVTTYLERDVRNLQNVGDLREFDRFLRAAALRCSQLVSVASMARDVGVAPSTAKSWLAVLEASHQVFFVEPYYRNAGKRLIKTPKLYFSEPGLLLWLLGFRSWDDATRCPMWGAIWECIAMAEIRKTLQDIGRQARMYFWRTASGAEVDLLLELGGGAVLAVECKAAAKIARRDLGGLHALARDYGEGTVANALVVCRPPAAYPVDSPLGVSAVPLAGPEGITSIVRKTLG